MSLALSKPPLLGVPGILFPSLMTCHALCGSAFTHKSEVLKRFKALIQQLETATGKKLKTKVRLWWRIFVKEFEGFLEEQGILLQKSVPYCPEQNSVAEHMGRTLVEKLEPC